MNFKDNDGRPVSVSKWFCVVFFWRGVKNRTKGNANEVHFHQVVLEVWPTKEIEFANWKNKTSRCSNNLASWEHGWRSAGITFISLLAPPKGWDWGLLTKKLGSLVLNLLFRWVLLILSPVFQCDIPKMHIKTKQSSVYLLPSALESRGGSLQLPPTWSGSSRHMSGRYVTGFQPFVLTHLDGRTSLSAPLLILKLKSLPPLNNKIKLKKTWKENKKPAAQTVNQRWKFHQTKRHQLAGPVHFWSIYTFLNTASNQKS